MLDQINTLGIGVSVIVLDALEREAALYRVKARVLKERIESLEERYGMDSETFRRKFEAGELGDSGNFFLWWSLLEALKAVEGTLRNIEEELHKLQ